MKIVVNLQVPQLIFFSSQLEINHVIYQPTAKIQHRYRGPSPSIVKTLGLFSQKKKEKKK